MSIQGKSQGRQETEDWKAHGKVWSRWRVTPPSSLPFGDLGPRPPRALYEPSTENAMAKAMPCRPGQPYVWETLTSRNQSNVSSPSFPEIPDRRRPPSAAAGDPALIGAGSVVQTAGTGSAVVAAIACCMRPGHCTSARSRRLYVADAMPRANPAASHGTHELIRQIAPRHHCVGQCASMMGYVPTG